mgnify:CR=1 FL=1
MADGQLSPRPRIGSALEEMAWQWGEMRRLLQDAAQQLRRLLAARPWERELASLERRVAELEAERELLWQELWQLRHRVEEMSGLPLADRLALAREELTALTQEIHSLASLVERLDGSIARGRSPERRITGRGEAGGAPLIAEAGDGN